MRADEIVSPGSIPQQIRYYVKNSEVVIADITGHNLNVFYEVGIRHGANGKAILLVRDIDDVPSDLKSDRVIVYDLATPRGWTKAMRDLEGMLDEVLTTARCAT
ncbi:MAG: hypothetical protein JXN61_05850 [Sedimentisphaerales bacterium]|nr:hypothetical protein [Sedimentisphaerales bacterium]